MTHKVHAKAIGRKYNWQRQVPDARDHRLKTSPYFLLTAVHALPSAVDLRSGCSPVYDQGSLGSCTANALVGALEYLENTAHDLEVDQRFSSLSRLFVYFNERVVEGTVRQDSGAQLRDGIKVLASVGACAEPLFPYKIEAFSVKPVPEAFVDAANRRITAYAQVEQSVAGLKQALASGYPVAFGFIVFDSFESEEVATSGMLQLPHPHETNQGGHAVLMVGYDDADQTFLVRNSWSADWGIGGYFKMPYSYAVDPSLASDFWVIRK